MPEQKFQNKYRIKSSRTTWHDYGGGTYFVTVCTKNYKHSFGKITNVETRHATSLRQQAHPASLQPSIQLFPIGQFLTEKIQTITAHCQYAEIPLFVVMPNHWHAIVLIDGNKTPYVRKDTVGARHTTPLPGTGKNKQMQDVANQQSWLSITISGIKSAVTKFAHGNGVNFAWQARFHDHIIRNQEEINRIADYIENNPVTWGSDCFNKNNNT